MSASAILILFLAVLGAEYAVNMWLTALDIRHVRRRQDTVPERFREWIDETAYRKSVNYTLAHGRFDLAEQTWDTAFLAAFAGFGGFGWFDNLTTGLLDWFGRFGGLGASELTASRPLAPLARGLIYVALISLSFILVSIPFRLYSQFVIEERFGFNKMTWKLWLADFAKTLALSAALGAPVLLGLLWFMDAAGAWWWVWAAAFLCAVMVFLQMIYPVLIAPRFNKFTPLADGELKQAIEALAGKIGFRMAGIYEMDASRRSAHGNAYFAGFGAGRRIVLFDTLIRNLNVRQIVAVLAHEMGHWKLRHVGKRLVIAGATELAAFYLLSLLMRCIPFYEAFGLAAPAEAPAAPAPYRALTLFAFCGGPFLFFFTPLFTALSRRHEYQADRFAVGAIGGASDMIEALLRLSRDNLTNLTPHPWYSFFHYSHPTLAERLAALERSQSPLQRA